GTARLGLQVTQALTVENHGVLGAIGLASTQDVIGPGGGTITIAARDVAIAGRIDVSALSATGIPAGPGGHIELDADGSVVLAPTAALDASAAKGGCGGSVAVEGPPSGPAAGARPGGGAAVARGDAVPGAA